jgi:hypothetical protein
MAARQRCVGLFIGRTLDREGWTILIVPLVGGNVAFWHLVDFHTNATSGLVVETKC